MTSLSRNARIAGLLYLTLLIAPLRLIYIPNKLFVPGASATANNIAAHATLFRLGITATMAIFLSRTNNTLKHRISLNSPPLTKEASHTTSDC